MKEYQTNAKNFGMPHCVYMQALWAVRDYKRLKLENDSEEKKDVYNDRIAAIEGALRLIPPEYHKDLLDNIIYHIKLENLEHEHTHHRWKQRFLFYVANNMGLNR